MSVLEWFRKFTWVLAISYILQFLVYVFLALLGLSLIVGVIVRGRFDQLPELLSMTAGALSVVGFVLWVFYDAQRSLRRMRIEREAERSEEKSSDANEAESRSDAE